VSDGPPIDAARVIADLRELDRRTGGSEGARRLCWGEEWRAAREFLRELLGEIGLEAERDEAGNLWARLEGESEPALAVGSHLDSVPAGGWLDGALGVMAGVGVLRAWGESGERPPRSLTLVDWADEEGARFGRSLLGSSAFSGSLQPHEVRNLSDAEGRTLEDVLAENGVTLGDDLTGAAEALEWPLPGAYLELHIEQGPVLESEGLSVAAVAGCAGVERHRFRFHGQASHAGTTPMDARRDAALAAAETALAVERIAQDLGGVGTTGALALRPGIPTAVAGEAELLVDLRHPDAPQLETMFWSAVTAARDAGARRDCRLEDELVWQIEPLPFDADLVAAALEVVTAAGGRSTPMTSGALHDAAEVGRVLPAAMVFVPSIAGISHAKEENTSDADLAAGIEVFGALANRVLANDQ
jgi:hydantoinase/carbamoylase family amidase